MKQNIGEKAAVITWCDNNGPTNYGQILQCYAMQNMIENYGYETIVIQYRRKTDLDFYKGKFLRGGFFNQFYEILFKVFLIEKKYDKRIYQFRKFIREYINLSEPCYDRCDVEGVTQDCAYLICGSDQIWNPIWYDSIYFLAFGHAAQRRLAYAPSGVAVEDNYTQALYKKMGRLINRIDYVSMRESQGIDIMKKYTDKNIDSVLDPTLLLSREDWDKVAAKRLVEEPYIFCYIMGSVRQHKLVLKQIMLKHNAKRIVFIPSNVVGDSLSIAMPYTSAGPAEFISLIKYAEAVVTDSFHGTTLSIKYRKQFYILKRIQRECYRWANISRIENVLDKLQINVRLVNNVKDVYSVSDINYDIVDINEAAEIDKSKCFLQKAFT